MYSKDTKKLEFNQHQKSDKITPVIQADPEYMNTWMIGKKQMKHHYQKKKICTVILTWKILLMQIVRMQKKFVKFSKEKNRCM